MAHGIVAVSVTFEVIQLLQSFFRWDFLSSCAAIDTISTDNMLVKRSPCDG